MSVIASVAAARSSRDVIDVVRTSVRRLVGCDGATFVLRDENCCYYVDEDAIGPLWKGQRFPIEACVSGWAMLHREAVVVPDIRSDARVPYAAYEPTFVRSLVMVPIRSTNPIGAIGAYWSEPGRATEQAVAPLQALADSASVALENVALLAELEARVDRRTAALTATVRDLEQFSAAIAHDLRNPLCVVLSNASLLEGEVDAGLQRDIGGDIVQAANRMSQLIADLLRLSKVTAADLVLEQVDAASLARSIAWAFQQREPERVVDVTIGTDLVVLADRGLLLITLENLIGNAWKFTSRRERARIEIGAEHVDGSLVLFVRDNGAGFDTTRATRLFSPFVRFHAEEQFKGTGVGLATVARIVEKHGGRIWAESTPDVGSTFRMTFSTGQGSRP